MYLCMYDSNRLSDAGLSVRIDPSTFYGEGKGFSKLRQDSALKPYLHAILKYMYIQTLLTIMHKENGLDAKFTIKQLVSVHDATN